MLERTSSQIVTPDKKVNIAASSGGDRPAWKTRVVVPSNSISGESINPSDNA
jgi:hypothetical protein